MVKPRVPETEEGIQGEFETQAYDSMMRLMRNMGWMETSMVIKAGITSGLALELGPGPGYLGLEWLKHTQNTTLKGVDISQDMIGIAERNAGEYRLTDRVEYVIGNVMEIPFEDEYFDAVFSNGSLHEWAEPEKVLNEVARVLKPGGRYCISDMKRDMNPVVSRFLWLVCRPTSIRPWLISSINSSYIVSEIEDILSNTKLQGWQVSKNFIGLVISGQRSEER